MSTENLVSLNPAPGGPSNVGSPKPPDVDAQRLEHRLRSELRGEVRFDNGSRALYATDGSNYRQVPIGVVLPRNDDDVRATLAAGREFGAPILARGGGTSLAGQCCNVAVVIDFSKYMNQILELNREDKIVRVQPGIVLDEVRKAATQVGLTFGPDPATHSRCTLGGMIGNNSCGTHSVMAGKTVDNIHELRILTYDGLEMTVGATPDAELQSIIGAGGRRGEIYRSMREIRDRYGHLIRAKYPKIPRRVSGFNLDELLPEAGFHVARALVGSESTCVIVLEAKLRLVHNPSHRSLVVLAYRDIYLAADQVPDILPFGPIALEAIDGNLVADIRKKNMHVRDLSLLPDGHGFLLVEFGGDIREEADDKAQRMMEALKRKPNAPNMKFYDDKREEQLVWEIRESGLGATAFVPGKPFTWEGWEDSAVPPEKMGSYLRQLSELYQQHGYTGAFYGHFGQGCLHTRINFDLESAPGIRKYRTVRRRSCGSGRQLRRVPFRRTWRRPISGRTVAEDVRTGTDPGVPRFQGRLGPTMDDESWKGGERLSSRRKFAAGRELPSLGTGYAFPISRGRRQLCAGGVALRRCWGMPPSRK